MRRQENDRTPVLEQEPHRLDWSRTEIALDRDAELGGVAPARGVEITLGLAFEVVAHAAVDVRGFARDAQQPSAGPVVLDPDGAALPPAVHDAMRKAAQRHFDAMSERRCLRHALEPRRNPSAVLLRKFLRLLDAAAWRHGENHCA